MKSGFSISEIIKILTLILLAISVYLAVSRVDSFLKTSSISDCAKISSYTVKDDKATVSYPVQDVYEKCLEDKGIKLDK